MLLPYLLVSYEKILYLDVDICVFGDVAELYNADIGDCFLGGVRDLGMKKCVATRAGFREWGMANGFSEWDGYINSGILIMNLAAFRAEEGIFGRLIAIAVAGADHFPDQDALNFVCKGRIKYFDYGWNVMTLPKCAEVWRRKLVGPAKVIHYGGPEKP